MEVYTFKKDTDGTGTYVDDIIEVRFAPDSYGEPDWDWDTNYSVQISGTSYTAYQGSTELGTGTISTSGSGGTTTTPSGIPVYTLTGSEGVTEAGGSTALVGDYAIEVFTNSGGTTEYKATAVVSDGAGGWQVDSSNSTPINLNPISDQSFLVISVCAILSTCGSGGSTAFSGPL